MIEEVPLAACVLLCCVRISYYSNYCRRYPSQGFICYMGESGDWKNGRSGPVSNRSDHMSSERG